MECVLIFFQSNLLKYSNDNFDDATPSPQNKSQFYCRVKVSIALSQYIRSFKINNHSITCSYSFPSLLMNSFKMNNIFNYVYKDIN